MKPLALELAELIVDRDSFTVNGELTGHNKLDYKSCLIDFEAKLEAGIKQYDEQQQHASCVVQAFRIRFGCDICKLRSTCDVRR